MGVKIEPNWIAFGERLKELLVELDLRQADLAKKLHKHRSRISRTLSGQARRMSDCKDVVEYLARRGAFKTPYELLDLARLIGWKPRDEWLRNVLREWFDQHKALLHGPTLPDQIGWVPRKSSLALYPDAEEQIVAWLVRDEAYRTPAVKEVMIGGMTGIGKTELARRVVEDQLVLSTFRGGILWTTCVSKADLQATTLRWSGLPGVASDSPLPPSSLVARFLASDEKPLLIVLDDVQPGSDFERFMVGGSQCRWLMTSRTPYLADRHTRVRKLNLSPPDSERCLELALCVLDRDASDDEIRKLQEMIRLVDHLPGAIVSAAAGIKAMGFEHVLQNLRGRNERTLSTLSPERLDGLSRLELDPSRKTWTARFSEQYSDLRYGDPRRVRQLVALGRIRSTGTPVLAAVWGERAAAAGGAAHRLFENSLLLKTGSHRYRVQGLTHDFAASLTGRTGKHEAKGRWSDGYTAGPSRQRRCRPYLPDTTASRHEKSGLWEAFFTDYWKAVRKKWKADPPTGEERAIGHRVRRRYRSYMRYMWTVTLAVGLFLAAEIAIDREWFGSTVPAVIKLRRLLSHIGVSVGDFLIGAFALILLSTCSAFLVWLVNTRADWIDMKRLSELASEEYESMWRDAGDKTD
ncbi:MAG: helix-turn-helix domain-containing protein [Anaerolineales bacterium]|nr:MAG: helix-turn-helix domain-containing protein [Anaerolineales bacterium]